jgi:hypothetical protein
MFVVYVAGPYRAKDAWAREQNIRRAEEAAFALAEMGAAPLCPHTMTRFFDGTLSDDYWLAVTLELMRRCDAILLLDGWERSAGARAEAAEADGKLLVFRGLDAVRAYLKAPPGR